VVTNRRSGESLTVRICGECGHVAIPKNVHDYVAETASVVDFGTQLKPRHGTEDTPGREYAMANLGITVLGRRPVDVLVYGAGKSIDNRHIATLEAVGTVAIGDVVRVRDDVDFVDTTLPASRTFDVVVACEVIEHFVKPRADFPRLFEHVDAKGLLICSTNVYDGGDLSRQGYIYERGHVSYYTPKALRAIARENGIHVDFRVPLSATGQAGPRKRYVFFSRSLPVMEALSDFFGQTMYAPSEPPAPRRS
jgi:hypothetical protein